MVHMIMTSFTAALLIAPSMFFMALCGAVDASEEGEAVALLNTIRSQNGKSGIFGLLFYLRRRTEVSSRPA